jgi:cytochrome b6-f complex iron-sulfur subunit
MSPLGDEHLSRRVFLRRTLSGGSGLVALASLPLLSACTNEEPFPGIRVELSELPENGRLVVMDGEQPVELVREDGVIQARSLFCTHQGCLVEWNETEQRYLCPCHQGVFDATGRPILGPPERPLRRFPVRNHEGFVQVDTRTTSEPE